jgi:hypothetical protein
VKSLAIAIAVGLSSLYLIEAARYSFRLFKWLPREERWERAVQGCCPNCGYDLTANVSGICPECGTKLDGNVIDNKAAVAPTLITEKQPWWVWTAVLIAIATAVIVQRLLWP